MAAWLWINDLLMAQKVSCSLHELVCVRFVSFVYPVMVTGLCFLSLDCRDCARIRMCGEQLMLYATINIVRLSSYRRLCRTADENLLQELVRKRNQKTIKQSPRSDSTSLPNLCYGPVALRYLKAPQWQEGCAGPTFNTRVL